MRPEFLDDLSVASLLDFTGVRCALDDVFADLARGRAQAMARHRIDCDAIKLSAMGGIWLSRGVAGIKSYPTVQGRFSFMVNLFDLVHDRPCAVIAGTELTRFRTAALAALVASRCARLGPCRLALIGAGVQGQSIAQALTEVCTLQEVTVVDPMLTPDRAAQLAARLGVPVRLAGVEEAVRHADLVVTATRSKTPVFEGAWLRPGTLVLAIGTSLPNGTELDGETLRRAARVIVEWKPQSLLEAGEVVLGRASGALADEKVVDLPELYRAQQPWRATPGDIVVFKSVGIGLADVAAGWLAVQRATGRAQARREPA